jgi:ATP-dependent helicase/nuclease subunit A
VERRLRPPLDLPVRDVTVLAHADGHALGGGGRSFTDEQLTAIERRDGPLLLSASAGSGKTSVLVERFVRSVIEDGLRPAQVLAITFTDKAAGELRSRVRARLLDAGEREAARDAEAAWIMTFHGFCARVLRAHAVAAGLDPAFSVLDEPGARALRREAFDAALAAFLADRPDGSARTDALDVAAAYTPDRLADMVWGAHDHLRSRGQTRPRLPSASPVDVAAARAALDAAAANAAAALASARALVSIDRAREAVAACREALAALPADEPAAGAALKAAGFGTSAAELREPPCAAYLDALATYGAACRDARARPVLALLDELLDRCADAYAAAKRGRSAVDFDDLELRTRDLFARAPAAAAGYAERFARVMVDEFQDTNPLQLAILGFLDRGNVFTVGDELQSIYGFRHADVEVFRARRTTLAAHDATATLATSFRARPEILETIDAAFGDVHGSSWVALRPGRDDPSEDEPRVELLLTEAAAWEGAGLPELGEGLPAAAAARHAEARLVAQRIGDLVHSGEARAGDVAVLLRAATDIGLYERAIELEGMAALASGGRGWWGRRQVQDLCCYLGALGNPRDEQALLGLLASPLVGLSSDALALVSLAARGRRGGALWDAASDPAVRLPPADAERLASFRSWFPAERERAGRLALDELLARVVRRTSYDLHVLALPGGARRLANVHKLMRLAAAFEGRRGRDVRGFIDHATAELEADAREPDAPVDLSGLQAVRLMTIHAAKGLEFPVVVVADLGRRGSTQHPDLLVDGDRVGLRLVGLDNTKDKALDWDDLAAARRAAEEAEERRIMHVAMTRAKERLILSGAVDLEKGWPTASAGAPPLAWMGPALLPDPAALSAAAPELVREWDAAGHPGRIRAALNTPATLGLVLRLGPGAPGEQLSLALGDAAEVPVEPPAPRDPVPRDAADAAAPPGVGAPPGVVAPSEAPSLAARPAPPATISYSSLGRYAACPYRFHLERHLGLPEQEPPEHLRDALAPAEGLDPLLRGTLVHELLERLEPGAPAPDADGVRAIAAAHETELAEEEVVDLLAMVRAFAASDVSARLGAAVRVRREHGFAFPLSAGGPLVNGFVDAVAFEADGTALVVDYKSDRVEAADLEALVEASYGVQRRIYGLACLRGGAPAVEVVHVFLERAGEPVVHRYEAADAPRLEADLHERAAGLLAGEFPVAAVPHRGLCATCPGRAGLCSHPPERTDRTPEEALASQ